MAHAFDFVHRCDCGIGLGEFFVCLFLLIFGLGLGSWLLGLFHGFFGEFILG